MKTCDFPRLLMRSIEYSFTSNTYEKSESKICESEPPKINILFSFS